MRRLLILMSLFSLLAGSVTVKANDTIQWSKKKFQRKVVYKGYFGFKKLHFTNDNMSVCFPGDIITVYAKYNNKLYACSEFAYLGNDFNGPRFAFATPLINTKYLSYFEEVKDKGGVTKLNISHPSSAKMVAKYGGNNIFLAYSSNKRLYLDMGEGRRGFPGYSKMYGPGIDPSISCTKNHKIFSISKTVSGNAFQYDLLQYERTYGKIVNLKRGILKLDKNAEFYKSLALSNDIIAIFYKTPEGSFYLLEKINDDNTLTELNKVNLNFPLNRDSSIAQTPDGRIIITFSEDDSSQITNFRIGQFDNKTITWGKSQELPIQNGKIFLGINCGYISLVSISDNDDTPVFTSYLGIISPKAGDSNKIDDSLSTTESTAVSLPYENSTRVVEVHVKSGDEMLYSVGSYNKKEGKVTWNNTPEELATGTSPKLIALDKKSFILCFVNDGNIYYTKGTLSNDGNNITWSNNVSSLDINNESDWIKISAALMPEYEICPETKYRPKDKSRKLVLVCQNNNDQIFYQILTVKDGVLSISNSEVDKCRKLVDYAKNPNIYLSTVCNYSSLVTFSYNDLNNNSNLTGISTNWNIITNDLFSNYGAHGKPAFGKPFNYKEVYTNNIMISCEHNKYSGQYYYVQFYIKNGTKLLSSMKQIQSGKLNENTQPFKLGDMTACSAVNIEDSQKTVKILLLYQNEKGFYSKVLTFTKPELVIGSDMAASQKKEKPRKL
ncbi:MAG: hypothetical protein K9M56_09210 [Victivallales bacterium]|nr:hypothetical protein [Victivallales bacterium]